MNSEALYVGLMSGTSLDGVDAVLMTLGHPEAPRHIAHAHQAFDAALRQELLALNTPGEQELHRAALAANAVARAYATVTQSVLTQAGVQPEAVRAIGAHGQTVRHQPGVADGVGYTCQLLNAALLAELTGIGVVYDLRSRDLAAGGQGAPLVPAFHRAVLGSAAQDIAVLNIGGIANLSLLHHDGSVLGFDTGPGNCLMDGWCEQHLGKSYDDAGAWAAQGHLIPSLLDQLLSHPYFERHPPCSTGRDDFNPAWLQTQLSANGSTAAPAQDVQRTLLEFTALSITRALQSHGQGLYEELLVCGGGVFNSVLMARLQALNPQLHVLTTAVRGIDPMHMEAAAFAWLAWCHINQQTGNLPGVTGARGARILGSYCPA
ncbi:anhydro-N-acetylmuramic acid kinase [Roseateles sp. BYS180W]|uniref:Anhydro-N-acetylmuramic acid kinase n=1 Tax=Roseateles rivi TaxID=3299028 RepID=A0ABW7FXD8_9BURK